LSGVRLILLRHALVLRRNRPWRLIVFGVFEPFLYLASLGVGLGTLVGRIGDDGTPVRYAAFVAPALLATSAMNTSVEETTVAVWVRLRFGHFYQAIVTTPLRAVDIVRGEVTAAMLRGTLATLSFLAIVTALGLVESWWGLLLLPAALVVAFGFAGVGMAVATLLRSWHHQQYVQLVMLPMFLFATTFYPLSSYPSSLRWIVAALPLTQATELLRDLSLGRVGADLLVSIAYLGLLGFAGLSFAARRFSRLLLQ
jgi:lipooligosaccharide transport system permease protein